MLRQTSSVSGAPVVDATGVAVVAGAAVVETGAAVVETGAAVVETGAAVVTTGAEVVASVQTSMDKLISDPSLACRCSRSLSSTLITANQNRGSCS